MVRRFQLLTTLLLLFSGLLQPLSAAQGQRCARPHAPADVAQQNHGSPAADGGATEAVGRPNEVTSQKHHSPKSQPDGSTVRAAPCGTAAVPPQRSTLLQPVGAPSLLSAGDLPPASLLLHSLFRPPRLS